MFPEIGMLKLYNTLTRKEEAFVPLKKNSVGMYVCGPTVNDVPHLGHARQQICFDVLRKYLKFLGFNVKFVSNITDVDDKIINKAREKGEDIKKLTERNMKAHLEDYRAIGIDKPDVQPRATEYIEEMIKLIKRLEQKGYTYVIEDDGVYFDISKFKNYGKLSHQKTEDLMAGKRIAVKDEKRNKEDFVLWKFSKKGEPSWNAPWGKGRPGWHIECSAMSEKILGTPFDIHGGGQDLIFPHHEDELAQSEAATGKKFVNYWVHNGMVNVDKVKMSKSLDNFKTIRDILKEYDGEVIRYFVLSTQYRKPIDFSKSAMDDAKNSYERIKNIISDLKEDKEVNSKYLKKFREAMDDDLNTPEALAVLWKLIRDKDAKGKIETIKEIDKVLGLNLEKSEEIEVPKEVKKLIKDREEARKKKDWQEADNIRNRIKKLGYSIDDTDDGARIKKL